MEKRPTITYVQTFQQDKKSFEIPDYMEFVPAKIQEIVDEPSEED